MTLPLNNQDAYNKFYQLPNFSMNIINYLIIKNDLIWKLLYYSDNTAWNETNLTRKQKSDLIYAGQPDPTKYRVFQNMGMPEAWETEACLLCVSPFQIVPDNRTIGTVTMSVEVYAHWKINQLSNYNSRIDLMSQQILETLNGQEIGGIGKLYFDAFATRTDQQKNAGTTPFKGHLMLMSNHAG